MRQIYLRTLIRSTNVINDKTYSITPTLIFEFNYVMIRQRRVILIRLIRLNGFVSQFLVHSCNYFLTNLH
jgi:hypothetical protein